MKIALITDAWRPQINGVVTTLVELVDQLSAQGHLVEVFHPGLFRTRPCPGYAGIDLAVRPFAQLQKQLQAFQPQAIHIATEGPLGWAARKYCLRHELPFTTAFHTRFPEILKAALRVPLWLGYALFRHFHRPSAGVMVPTQGVMRLLDGKGFKNLRSWTHGVDMRLFKYAEQVQHHPSLADLPRPIALYVGRVSYEKNIESFLAMPWHGSKVVCGVGPLEAQLKARFHDVRWLGVLPRDELAEVYASADVFTFPSRNETFGLVMLEAMACGTPVAAYPVDGPLEVLRPDEAYPHVRKGGVLDDDLAQASLKALHIPRAQARSQALTFSWDEATRLFEHHLAPIPSEKLLSKVTSGQQHFLKNTISDGVFEKHLKSTHRFKDYLQVREKMLSDLFTDVRRQWADEVGHLVSINHFEGADPALRVLCKTVATELVIDIQFPSGGSDYKVICCGQNFIFENPQRLSHYLQEQLHQVYSSDYLTT